MARPAVFPAFLGRRVTRGHLEPGTVFTVSLNLTKSRHQTSPDVSEGTSLSARYRAVRYRDQKNVPDLVQVDRTTDLLLADRGPASGRCRSFPSNEPASFGWRLRICPTCQWRALKHVNMIHAFAQHRPHPTSRLETARETSHVCADVEIRWPRL